MKDQIEVIPSSASIILRVTHILLIEIAAANPGEWVDASPGTVRRENKLTVRLEEVLKGETRQQSGEQLAVTVTQYDTKTTRLVALPGVWSEQVTDAGTRLIIYAVSDGEDAAALLTEPECRRITPAERDLPSLRLALKAEIDRQSLPEVLSAARKEAASLSEVFAEYLWARYKTDALKRPEYYQDLMDFLKLPELPYAARATLLDAVYSHLTTVPGVSEERVDQLARTMIQLLAVPTASGLNDNVVDVFLPNLLGLVPGKQARPAEQVFAGDPQLRQEAENLLGGYRGRADASGLRSWLSSGSK